LFLMLCRFSSCLIVGVMHIDRRRRLVCGGG